MQNHIKQFNNDFDIHEKKYINELERENYDMKTELSDMKREFEKTIAKIHEVEISKWKSNVKTQIKEFNLVILS